MNEILSIGELLDLGGSASTAGLIPYSALEYSSQKITAISGTAIGGDVDSATVTAIVGSAVSGKADQSALDQCCSSMSSVVSSLETSVTSMSSVVSGLTGDYLEKTASSMFQPSGDYAYQSSLSSYLPGSASSQFAPSGDYAYNSALSGKLDESAFTAYTASAPTAGHTYTGVDPIVVDNENDRISLSATSVQLDATMTSYMSGGSGFIGVNGNITSQMTAFVTTGDMSGFIPTSESSKYQLAANMSSFATTAQLSGKLDSSAQVVSSTGGSSYYVNKINGSSLLAETATNSTYATFVATNSGMKRLDDMWSSVTSLETGKLDATASSDFYGTGNPSGFTDYLPSFGYDGSKISSIDGSAVAGGWNYISPSGTIAIDNVSGSIDAWNSSMRVDAEVIPASSVSGSGFNEQGYRTGPILTGISSRPGDALYVNMVVTGSVRASAVFYGMNINGGSAVLTSFEMDITGGWQDSAYYSASAALNGSYSAIKISASSQGYTPSCSATATVERPGSTSYSTSVYEQVLNDAMWQSLTAWAVSQGWTP